jgi:hypothetical protein
MYTELIKCQPSSVNEALLPLLIGKPVALLVRDKKMLRKKRIGDPVLFITPSEVYGLGSGSIVLAMQGYGCQVEPKGKVKAERLFMMGLSMHAAKVLTKQLNDLWRQ